MPARRRAGSGGPAVARIVAGRLHPIRPRRLASLRLRLLLSQRAGFLPHQRHSPPGPGPSLSGLRSGSGRLARTAHRPGHRPCRRRFADNYYEYQRGKYFPEQSFTGDCAETSLSVYHLFDPERRIPLFGVLRLKEHYSTYRANEALRRDSFCRATILPSITAPACAGADANLCFRLTWPWNYPSGTKAGAAPPLAPTA